MSIVLVHVYSILLKSATFWFFTRKPCKLKAGSQPLNEIFRTASAWLITKNFDVIGTIFKLVYTPTNFMSSDFGTLVIC